MNEKALRSNVKLAEAGVEGKPLSAEEKRACVKDIIKAQVALQSFALQNRKTPVPEADKLMEKDPIALVETLDVGMDNLKMGNRGMEIMLKGKLLDEPTRELSAELGVDAPKLSAEPPKPAREKNVPVVEKPPAAAENHP